MLITLIDFDIGRSGKSAFTISEYYDENKQHFRVFKIVHFNI